MNIIKQGKHVLIAVCDLNLLGKKLDFGKIKFDVNRSFYGGVNVSVEEAVHLMRRGTTVNMVGPVVVKKAIEEGLINPESVIDISGIPHAQIVKV